VEGGPCLSCRRKPRDLWVLDRTLRILFGEVSQVVKGIRQSITKRALSGPKRKP
jgi:hypothetical protein